MAISEREMERVLKAFANRRRLAILRYILHKRRASVGDIADAIKLSFRSTSKHLVVLSAAGVVDKEQQSLKVIYRMADDMPPTAKHVLQLLR